MADVEQRAEAEAAAKGLSGQARKSYIGGVFNRIREAHARAVKPGQGKTFLRNLNRRNRQLARARYKEALRPHEEAVAALKSQRKGELAQLSYERPAKTALKISRRNPAHISVRDNFKEQRALHAAYGFDNLPPEVAARLRSLNGELNLRRAKESGGARSAMTDAERAARSTQARQEGFAPPSKPKARNNRAAAMAAADIELTPVKAMRLRDPRAPVDPVYLRELYGDHQLHAALNRYTVERLRVSAQTHGLSTSGSKETLVARLEAYGRGEEQPPKPAKPSAKPAARAQGATKVVREPAPPAGSRKPMASVRSYTYHGKPGFLITGRSGFNHRYSIFSESREEAERMRDDIKAGREPQFDAFRK